MSLVREWSLTYGSLSIGGSTARQPDGPLVFEDSYDSAAVEFSFITTAATDAAFASEISTVESALRTPWQDLTVSQNSSTLLSLKQSDNTGLDATPVILKQGDIGDTGRSRYYKCRIEFGRPANTSANTAFRRFATISLNYTPSRQREVTITGQYTANTDGTTARQQYLNDFAGTYAPSILTAIDSSVTWEKISEPQVEIGINNKVCSFTIVYKECLFNQTQASLDDNRIVNPVMIITREAYAPGDSPGIPFSVGSAGGASTSAPGVNAGSDATVATIPGTTGNPGNTQTGVQRPTILNVNYTCAVSKEQQTGAVQMATLYDGTLRPYIISVVNSLGGGTVVLIEDKPAFDPYSNIFSAQLQFLSLKSTVLRQRITVNDDTDYGKVFKPIWTGNNADYYKFPGPLVRVKTITEEREEITGMTNADAFVENLVRSGAVPAGLSSNDKWEIIRRTPEAAILKKGLVGDQIVNVAEVKVTTVLFFGNFRTGNSGGGGSGATVTAGAGSVAT